MAALLTGVTGIGVSCGRYVDSRCGAADAFTGQ